MKKYRPPCTIRLKDGTQFTADALRETEEGIYVYEWDGYEMIPAWLFNREPYHFVKWEEIAS